MTVFSSPFAPAPLSRESFYSFILKTNSAYAPDSPAFIDGLTGEVVTRAAFNAKCLTLASALRNAHQAGLQPLGTGSTVAVFGTNSILYATSMFALGAAGCRAAFANASYLDNELAHAMEISRASHILVQAPLLPTALSALALLGCSHAEAKKRVILLSHKDDIPSKLASEGWIGIDDLQPGDTTNIPVEFNGAKADETAVIYFSSGTTGRSKGVELSHYNITSMMSQTDIGWPYYKHGRDVLIAVLPFFHIFGGSVQVVFSYLKGIPLVVLPRFEPERFLSCIQKYKVTVALIVPPLLAFLTKHPVVDKFDLSSLRLVAVGAAPVGPTMFSDCAKRFAKRGIMVSFTNAYGLTEMTGSVAFLPIDRAQEKKGSVGPLMPNMVARLVDEAGQDVPIGEPGELWVYGPNVMKGYVGNEEATAATMTPDGWLKTGDVAIFDAEGYLSIVDRSKELIKYKGFQVPPAELEAVLVAHPGVADAGVIGVYSDEEGTELPRAYVAPKDVAILKQDQEAFKRELHAFVKEHVAPFKLLRGGIVLVDDVPRSAAGKILRKELRELAKKTYDSAKAKL